MGVNLLDEVLQAITDQQLAAFGVRTGYQRLDSTQIASKIRDARLVVLRLLRFTLTFSPIVTRR
jgi:hypothetical protein